MSHNKEYQDVLDSFVTVGACNTCKENKNLFMGDCKDCRDKSMAESMQRDWKRWSLD